MSFLQKIGFSVLNALLPNRTQPNTKSTAQKSGALTNDDFLKCNGGDVCRNHGKGEKVYLRGTNAGGWLIQEAWMCATNAPCQMDMYHTLEDRFGTKIRDELVAVYESHYFALKDFDNFADMGLSVIRLPFGYWNLTDKSGQLKPNAFSQLDWFIGNCQKRGIYVILDMHGAFGSQNGKHHSGLINDGRRLYHNDENMRKTVALWKAVADHYKGNPAVAGYDLLNEPVNDTGQTNKLQWDFYNRLYHEIRAVDKDHIIIMESCWGPENLPVPKEYNWENVMYQYHQYSFGNQNKPDNIKLYLASQAQRISRSKNRNVPTLIGEFTFWNNPEVWEYGLSLQNKMGWHWTTWSYKSAGDGTNAWGLFNDNGKKVDIYNDSAEDIRQKWSQVGTENAVETPYLKLISAYF